MVQNTKAQVVTYAVQGLADHTARILEQNFDGMLLKIDGTDTWCRLIGRHNAYNLLAIYSAAVSLGADPTETLVALSRLESAPGRLENLNGPKDLSVIVPIRPMPWRTCSPPSGTLPRSASSSASLAAAETATKPNVRKWRRWPRKRPTASSLPLTTPAQRTRKPLLPISAPD